MIYGNLTRDPEMRALPNGTPVTSFSVATNRVYKDKNGAKQESVDFHNIVVFARQAETVAQYLRKGSPVFVEGRIQTDEYTDKDGIKRKSTKVRCDKVVLLGSGGGRGGGLSRSSGGEESMGSHAPAPSHDGSDQPLTDDDIHFCRAWSRCQGSRRGCALPGSLCVRGQHE